MCFEPFICPVSYYKGSCNLRIPSCRCFCLENVVIICICSGRLRQTERLCFSPPANLHLFIWLIRSCHFKYVFNLFWSIKFDIRHPREPSYDGISLIIPICQSVTTYLSSYLSVCIFNCSKVSLWLCSSASCEGKKQLRDLLLLWFVVIFSQHLWSYVSEMPEKLFASKMYPLLFLQLIF